MPVMWQNDQNRVFYAKFLKFKYVFFDLLYFKAMHVKDTLNNCILLTFGVCHMWLVKRWL